MSDPFSNFIAGQTADPYNDGTISGSPDTTDIFNALIGTENSGSTAVSPKGATGRAQIMSAAFKQYAVRGENYNNEEDRVRAAKRKVDDDYSWASSLSDDPQKVAELTAAAYFGGRGGAVLYAKGQGNEVHDGNLNINQYVSRFMGKLGNRVQNVLGALSPASDVENQSDPSIVSNAEDIPPALDIHTAGSYAKPGRTSAADSGQWTSEMQRAEEGNKGVWDAIKHGGSDAIQQIPQLAYGTAAYLGDVFGNEWLKNTGLELYKAKTAEIEKDARSYQDIQDAWKEGSMTKWLGYALGYSGVQIAQAFGTGGVGAVLGKAGLKGALTATAKKASQEALETAASQAAQKASAIAIKDGAEAIAAKAAGDVAYQAVKADAKYIAASVAVGEKAASLAAAKFGGTIGLALNSEAMEIGQIYPDAVEQAQKAGTPVDLGRVTLAATGAAALDVLPEMRIGGKILGSAEKTVKDAAFNEAKKASERGLLGRVAREIPKQMLFEGATEGMQTPIEYWGAMKNPWSPEAIKDAINSAAMGSVGGAIGGVGAAISRPPPPRKETPPWIPDSPLSNAVAVGTPTPPADGGGTGGDGIYNTPSPFGDPTMDAMHQEVAAFMQDRNNIRTLQAIDPTLVGQIYNIWNGVINNPDAVQGQAINALYQVHGALNSIASKTALTVPQNPTPNFTMSPPGQETGGPSAFSDQGRPALTDQSVIEGESRHVPEPTIQGWNPDGTPWYNTNREQADYNAGMQAGEFGDTNRSVPPPPPAPPGGGTAAPSTSAELPAAAPAPDIAGAIQEINQRHATQRHDAIRQLVGQGFTSITKGDDGSFSLAHPKTGQSVPLGSPADVQVARAALKKQIDSGAHTAAASPNNDHTLPTPGQIEAGNYKTGQVELHGIPIAIENPQGSTRSGVSPEGNAWTSTLAHHYGYIKKAMGADGDQLDVFIGGRPDSQKVFVADQTNADGSFDEHKVLMGFTDEAGAKQGYLANYDKGWDGLGAMTEMTVPQFKEWMAGDTTQPVGRLKPPTVNGWRAVRTSKGPGSIEDHFEHPAFPDTHIVQHTIVDPKIGSGQYYTAYKGTQKVADVGSMDEAVKRLDFARAGEPIAPPIVSGPSTPSGETITPTPTGNENPTAEAQGGGVTVTPNTIVTDADAEKARQILRRKLGQLNVGIDPEAMQAGITLALYHIEKGARTFAAYTKAMIADLGEMVRPYLKSWYMGAKFDPRASALEGMSTSAEVEAADVNAMSEEMTPQDRFIEVMKKILAAGPKAHPNPNLWDEQIREQIATPTRYHPVVEDDNPKGLKIGDVVQREGETGYVLSVQKTDATAYAGGYQVHFISEGSYGGWTGIDNISVGGTNETETNEGAGGTAGEKGGAETLRANEGTSVSGQSIYGPWNAEDILVGNVSTHPIDIVFERLFGGGHRIVGHGLSFSTEYEDYDKSGVETRATAKLDKFLRDNMNQERTEAGLPTLGTENILSDGIGSDPDGQLVWALGDGFYSVITESRRSDGFSRKMLRQVSVLDVEPADPKFRESAGQYGSNRSTVSERSMREFREAIGVTADDISTESVATSFNATEFNRMLQERDAQLGLAFPGMERVGVPETLNVVPADGAVTAMEAEAFEVSLPDSTFKVKIERVELSQESEVYGLAPLAIDIVSDRGEDTAYAYAVNGEVVPLYDLIDAIEQAFAALPQIAKLVPEAPGPITGPSTPAGPSTPKEPKDAGTKVTIAQAKRWYADNASDEVKEAMGEDAQWKTSDGAPHIYNADHSAVHHFKRTDSIYMAPGFVSEKAKRVIAGVEREAAADDIQTLIDGVDTNGLIVSVYAKMNEGGTSNQKLDMKDSSVQILSDNLVRFSVPEDHRVALVDALKKMKYRVTDQLVQTGEDTAAAAMTSTNVTVSAIYRPEKASIQDAGAQMFGARKQDAPTLGTPAVDDEMKDVEKYLAQLDRMNFVDPSRGGADQTFGAMMFLEALLVARTPTAASHIASDDVIGNLMDEDGESIRGEKKRIVQAIRQGFRGRVVDAGTNYADALILLQNTVATAGPTVEEVYLTLMDAAYPPDANGNRGTTNGEWTAVSDMYGRTLFPMFEELLAKFGGGKQYSTDQTEREVKIDPKIPPHLEHIVRRNMPDWREGKDVSVENDLIQRDDGQWIEKETGDFTKMFGLRGVEFGNWVTQVERQTNVNMVYDALMDMAHILGIPPTSLGLNGKLGLAIGSRGKGGRAAAHFEPDNNVINLTKTKGNGTVSHEWFHALDNMLRKSHHGKELAQSLLSVMQAKRDVGRIETRFRSILQAEASNTANRSTPPREAALRFVLSLSDLEYGIGNGETTYFVNAKNMDGPKAAKPYWGTDKEMLARAFEALMFDLVKGGTPYLTGPTVADGYMTPQNNYLGTPYALGEERKILNGLFQHFLTQIDFANIEAKTYLAEGKVINLDGKYLVTDQNGQMVDVNHNPKANAYVSYYDTEKEATSKAKHISGTTRTFGPVQFIKQQATNIAVDLASRIDAIMDEMGVRPWPQVKNDSMAESMFYMMRSGWFPNNNADLKDFIAKAYKKNINTISNDLLKMGQEDFEAALARRVSQQIVDWHQTGLDDRTIFHNLVAIYKSQPNLNLRTTESKNNQAFSTPIPMAFVAGLLGRVDQQTTVYEPTAGNGLLVINANSKRVIAVELQPHRALNLKLMEYNVKHGNAMTALEDGLIKLEQPDVVLANPPFGSAPEEMLTDDGYLLKKLDQQISYKALQTLPNSGRAVLIIGANRDAGIIGLSDSLFFNWLYRNYNVADHFEVAGDLYSRMGARWPVRVIVIAGRHLSDKVSPVNGEISRVEDWDQFWSRANEALQNSERVLVGSSREPDTVGGANTPSGGIRGGSGNKNGKPSGDGATGGSGLLPKPPRVGGGDTITNPDGSTGKGGLQPESGGRQPNGVGSGGNTSGGGSGNRGPGGSHAGGLSGVTDLSDADLEDLLGGLDPRNTPATGSKTTRNKKQNPSSTNSNGAINAPPNVDLRKLTPANMENFATQIRKGIRSGEINDNSTFLQTGDNPSVGISFVLDNNISPESGTILIIISSNDGEVTTTYENSAFVMGKKGEAPTQEGVPGSNELDSALDDLKGAFNDIKFSKKSYTRGAEIDGSVYDRLYDKLVAVFEAVKKIYTDVKAAIAEFRDRIIKMFGEDKTPQIIPYIRTFIKEEVLGFSPLTLKQRLVMAEIDNDFQRVARGASHGDYAGIFVPRSLYNATNIALNRLREKYNFNSETGIDESIIKELGYDRAPSDPVGEILLKAKSGRSNITIRTPIHEGDSFSDKNGNTLTAASVKTTGRNTFVVTNMGTEINADSITAVVPGNRFKEGTVDAQASIERLYKALGGYQIDTLALAIDAMRSNNGFVMGHDTGVGKGRAVAAMLVWATKNGKIPVFVTNAHNLYSAMYADLVDIGYGHLKIAMTNTNNNSPIIAHPYMRDNNDEPVIIARGSAEGARSVAAQLNAGTLGADILFTTYDQLKGKDTGADRYNSLAQLAREGKLMFVLDEAHKAAGDPVGAVNPQDTVNGRFMSFLTGNGLFRSPTGAVIAPPAGWYPPPTVYSTATFSKRAINLPLYARTHLRLAGDNDPAQLKVVFKDDNQLMQVASEMLVESGHMLRFERSVEGIELLWDIDDTKSAIDARAADNLTAVLRSIMMADEAFTAMIRNPAWIKDTLPGLMPSGTMMTDAAGRNMWKNTTTDFSDVVHNYTKQILFAVKADLIVKRFVGAIGRGEKPVVAFENTMASALQHYLKAHKPGPGGILPDFNWQAILKSTLDRRHTIKLKQRTTGKPLEIDVPYSHMYGTVVAEFNAVEELIQDLDSEISPSPIDTIKHEIQKYGVIEDKNGKKSVVLMSQNPEARRLNVGEITGRTTVVNYDTADGIPVVGTRKKGGAHDQRTIDGFQDGDYNKYTVDGIMLNIAGSVGISLHPSEKAKDQSPRHMVVAQPMADIAAFKQVLGRISRTGQVEMPIYTVVSTAIPAEKRILAMMRKKFSAMLSGTSGQADAATDLDVTDFINQVGDKAVADYFRENQEAARMLRLTANDFGANDASVAQDFALKASGRMSLMPVEDQAVFYDTVEQLYADRIRSLNELNANPLIRSTEDYEARPVPGEEIVLVEGENEEMPFQRTATLQKMSIKPEGNPPLPDVVFQHIARGISTGTNGAVVIDPSNLDNNLLNGAFKDQRDKIVAALVVPYDQADAVLKGKRADLEAKLANPTTLTQKQTQAYTDNLAGIISDQNNLDHVKARTLHQLERYRVGTMFSLVDADGGPDIFAVVTGINFKGIASATGNPYTMSNFDIKLLINRHKASLSFRLSQMMMKENDNEVIGRRQFDRNRIESEFAQVFVQGQREERWFASANIPVAINALPVRGRIVTYTIDPATNMGKPRSDTGMIMPSNFNPGTTGLRDNVRIGSFKALTQFIAAVAEAKARVSSDDRANAFAALLDPANIMQEITATEILRGRMSVVFAHNDTINIYITDQGRVSISFKDPEMSSFINNAAFAKLVTGGNSGFTYSPGANTSSNNIEASNLEEIIRQIRYRVPLYIKRTNLEEVRPYIAATEGKASKASSTGGKGSLASQVQTIVDQVSKKWKNGPAVHVYATVAEARAKTGLDIEAGTEGWYLNGQVHLIAENLHGNAHIRQVLTHEAVGHFAVEEVLGDKFENYLKRLTVMEKANPKIAEIGRAVDERQPGLSPQRRAAEIIAIMAERGMHNSLISRIMAAVRNFARNVLGIDIELNEHDVAAMIRKAADSLEGGSGPRGGVANSAFAASKSAPVFFSQLARSVAGAKLNNAPASEWKSWLLANAGKLGVKKEEIEWTGITDYLDLAGKEKISKADVLAFLDGNGIQVKEVLLGKESELVDGGEAGIHLTFQEAIDRFNQGLPVSWFRPENNQYIQVHDAESIENPQSNLRKDVQEGAAFWVTGGTDIDGSLISKVHRSSGMTKYGPDNGYADLSLSGGENYKELLLTLPLSEKVATDFDAMKNKYAQHLFDKDYGKLTAKQQARVDEVSHNDGLHGLVAAAKVQGIFKSSHFTQPNILAHIRFNERIDAEGKRVLFIEEIQSDWGEKGRKRGFVQRATDGWTATVKQAHPSGKGSFYIVKDEAGVVLTHSDIEGGEIWGATSEQDAIDKAAKLQQAPPTGPFVMITKSWTALALKRMIRYAAEHGFDRVAWATGEQQAARYKLSNHVAEVSWRVRKGDKNVTVEVADGDQLTFYLRNDGTVDHVDGTSVTQYNDKPISDIVGKELGSKIMTDADGRLSGEGLDIGGEGMKAFYDKIVPQVANDILKKIGGYGTEKFTLITEEPHDPEAGVTNYIDEDGSLMYSQHGEGSGYGNDHYHGLKGWMEQMGFSITRNMREEALKGLPLFSKGSAEPVIDVEQSITSAATSRKIVPHTIGWGDKHGTWKAGNTNFDIGSGKFSDMSQAMKDRGVTNLHYDPFWQTSEDNQAAIDAALANSPDTVTVNNILNVIKEPDARRQVIRQAAKAVDQAGTAFFLIYESDKSGVGKDTRDGYQVNARAETYMDSIKEFFDNVRRDGHLIIATGPKKELTAGQWSPAEGQPKFSIASITSSVTRDQIKERYADFMRTQKTVSWWDKSVGTMYNLAKRDPEHFGKVFELVQDFIDDTARYANTAADMAPGLLPKTEGLKDAVKGAFNMQKDAKDAQAIAEPIFIGTLEDTVWSDGELETRFGLTGKQIGLYHEFLNAINQSLDELTITEMTRLAKIEGLTAVHEDATLDEAVDHYEEQFQAGLESAEAALADLKQRQEWEMKMLEDASKDEASSAADRQKYADMVVRTKDRQRAEMTEATDRLSQFLELQKGIRGRYDQVTKLKEQGYAPLMRFGDYTVDVYLEAEDKDGKKTGKIVKNAQGEEVRNFFGMFESEAEANRAARILAEEYPDSTVKQGVLSHEASSLFSGVTPETVEVYAKLAGVEASEAFQKYLKFAVNNRSAMKRLLHRMGTAGFSEDPTRVLAAFITSNARASARNDHFGDMLRAAVAIPKEKGDIKDAAIELMQYVQNPKEEASALRGILFMNYLAGSIAAGLANMTQMFLQTFPYLHQFSPNTGKHLAWGMKLAGKKMFGQDIVIEGDEELTAALHRAKEEGITDPHEIHMLYGESSRTGALQNNRFIRNMTKVWGSFFALSEAFNRHATFLAAYKIAQENNLSGDKAYDFAKEAVRETQGIYNKGNRPAWARGAIGATLFTFKQFSIAYLEFLSRLPAKERMIALGILVLAAGVSGLPGSDDLDDLIDTLGQSFGIVSPNIKAWKKDMVTKIFGKDAAGFILYGVSHGLPLDIAGRMSVGNLLPGTGLLKRSEIDKTRDIQDFFGAVGSFGQNYMKAWTHMQDGDFWGITKDVAPKAVGDIGKAIDMLRTGEYHDTKGRLVDKATPLDAVIKAIGFQPTHLAEGSRERTMLQQNINLMKDVQASVFEKWAQGRYEHNPDKIAAAKAELAWWNRENPTEQIRLNVASIQKRVVEMGKTSNERFIKASPKTMRRETADALNSQ